MKLATAYIEIAARTDEFRRQLDEARQLATTTADAIRAAFQTPPEGTLPSRADDSTPDRKAQGPLPDRKFGAASLMSNSNASMDGMSQSNDSTGIPTGSLPDLLSGLFPDALPITVPDGAEPQTGLLGGLGQTQGSSASETVDLLRQQLDLGRNELDVLNKQLDVLQEVTQGVPAVLI